MVETAVGGPYTRPDQLSQQVGGDLVGGAYNTGGRECVAELHAQRRGTVTGIQVTGGGGGTIGTGQGQISQIAEGHVGVVVRGEPSVYRVAPIDCVLDGEQNVQVFGPACRAQMSGEVP